MGYKEDIEANIPSGLAGEIGLEKEADFEIEYQSNLQALNNSTITTNTGTINSSITLLTALISSGALKVSDANLEALISSGKLLVSEANSGTINSNIALLAALISSGALKVSDANLEALISSGKLLVSEANSATISSNTNTSLAQQIDTTSTAGYTYIGQAAAGTAQSAASWRIKLIDSYGNITWAGGNANFANIWNNRTALTYS